MSAIYKRELNSYFCGMTGAIFAAFLLLIVGVYATAMSFLGGYPSFEASLASVIFVLLLVVPIITMRSVSEDLRSRTDQLLYALPLPLSHVVLAKYFAMVTVLALPTAVMCLYPVVFSFYGTVNFAASYGAILAFFLLGCALFAIGMFISSLTESQVIAAVLTFAVFILLFLSQGLASMIPQTAGASLVAFLLCAGAAAFIIYSLTKNVVASACTGGALGLGLIAVFIIKSELFAGAFHRFLDAAALFSRFNNFASGIFDVSALIYYISVAMLFVFFTVQSMEKKRWA